MGQLIERPDAAPMSGRLMHAEGVRASPTVSGFGSKGPPEPPARI